MKTFNCIMCKKRITKLEREIKALKKEMQALQPREISTFTYGRKTIERTLDCVASDIAKLRKSTINADEMLEMLNQSFPE